MRGTLAHFLLLLGCAVLLPATPAFSALITGSASAPTGNVYLSSTGSNGTTYRVTRSTDSPMSNGDARLHGFTFPTLDAVMVESLTLQYDTNNSAAADPSRSNLVLALIQDSSASTPSDGSLLFSHSYDATGAFTQANYYTFDFGGSVSLNANSFYHFEIWFADAIGGASNDLNFARDQNAANNGDGIELYRRFGNDTVDPFPTDFPAGSFLVADNNSDQRNPVFYLNAVTAVPEPSTVIPLVLLAGGMLGLRRFRCKS